MSTKIYVFCNSCEPQWHSATALSDEGLFLAGHVCSHHGFIAHDMGVDEDGWKRDIYARAYPDGFEVEYVEQADVKTHPGITAAYAKHTAMGEDVYTARMAEIHKGAPR